MSELTKTLDLERINLIVKNMELLVDALKKEISPNTIQQSYEYSINDYDEVFNEDE